MAVGTVCLPTVRCWSKKVFISSWVAVLRPKAALVLEWVFTEIQSSITFERKHIITT